jgi:hypothetical protein
VITYNYFPDGEFLGVHPVIVVGLGLGLLTAQADVEHRDGGRRLCRDVRRRYKYNSMLFGVPVLDKRVIPRGMRWKLAYEACVVCVGRLWLRVETEARKFEENAGL